VSPHRPLSDKPPPLRKAGTLKTSKYRPSPKKETPTMLHSTLRHGTPQLDFLPDKSRLPNWLVLTHRAVTFEAKPTAERDVIYSPRTSKRWVRARVPTFNTDFSIIKMYLQISLL
jgi:hypothetical protein